MPDDNENTPTEKPISPSPSLPSRVSPFVPLLLLAAAMLAMTWYNYSALSAQGALIQRQIGQQQASVAQSEKGRLKSRRLLEDLLTMAETDPQAAAIVQKHRIQRVQNQVPATPPAQP